MHNVNKGYAITKNHVVNQILRTNDDKDEHERNFSCSLSYETTLWGYRKFGNEDPQIHHFEHFSNQKQFHNENDAYYEVVLSN